MHGCIAMTPTRDRSIWIARNVVPHEPALRSWLRRWLVAGIEADDIVQETYAVLASLACVNHIESPRAYAFQTAQSLIRRQLRRLRAVRFDPIEEIDLSAAAIDNPSPEHQTATRQELQRVANLIATLPSRRREAFVMRKIEGLSQRDIALRMGISESVVEKHIGHALRHLLDATRRGDERALETFCGVGAPRMNAGPGDQSTNRQARRGMGGSIGSRRAVA